jgi:hypothetical protein
MTRIVREMRLSQSVIVWIIFLKKYIILTFFKKLNYIFTNNQKYILIYKIN